MATRLFVGSWKTVAKPFCISENWIQNSFCRGLGEFVGQKILSAQGAAAARSDLGMLSLCWLEVEFGTEERANRF